MEVHTSTANTSQNSNEMILQQLFPCLTPVNAHMRNIQSRLSTFEAGWPRSKVRVSPRELAESGMFYLGKSDCSTKYLNGSTNEHC